MAPFFDIANRENPKGSTRTSMFIGLKRSFRDCSATVPLSELAMLVPKQIGPDRPKKVGRNYAYWQSGRFLLFFQFCICFRMNAVDPTGGNN